MIALLLASTSMLHAGDNDPQRPRSPDILVVRDGWDTDREDVRRVLESAAAPLWQHFPNQSLDPIIVYPKGGPITLFNRGPGNEYVVRLDTGSTYWSQYAYQFSHELCHILCRYDRDEHGNKWFEESLCEAASLYCLRRMSEQWKSEPPYPHWASFAPHLAEYADRRVKRNRLTDGETLARWYVRHEAELRKSATNRELNQIAAVALLPLFEAEPRHWEAIWWLNEAQPRRAQSIKEYLTDWYVSAPPDHRGFIRRVAEQLGVALKGSS